MEFNTEQQQIIDCIYGPVLCIAGPGSGKTTSIVQRTFNMIKNGVAPEKILVVTFTKAAATEMKERFNKLTGSEFDVRFSTIHSICFEILKRHCDYVLEDIITETDKTFFFTEKAKAFRIDASEITSFVSSVITQISNVKNNDIDLDTFVPEGCSKKVFEQLFSSYESYKTENNKIDFDDMILICLDLLSNNPDILSFWQNIFEFVIIDEFQDTNLSQAKILYMLAAPENNVCVIGDDDQSIYKFRGAKPEIMLGFENSFPDCKKIKLSTNYRSEPCIVEYSSRLIQNNKVRFEKDLKPFKNGEGSVLFKEFGNKNSEISYLIKEITDLYSQGVNLNDIAVLFRTNTQASWVVRELIDKEIDFCVNEKPVNIYKHWIFYDVLRYYRLSQGIGSTKDLLGILNHPNRYFNVKMFSNIESVSRGELYGCLDYIKEDWQRKKAYKHIDDMFQDFTVLKKMKPKAFIDYLFNHMGYSSFLISYAQYINSDVDELFDIVDVITASAEEFHDFESWIEYIEGFNMQFFSKMKKTNKTGVVLSTMHSAKGLEWDNVYIIDAIEGVNPHKKSMYSDLEEERRLFYVACTRAKTNLNVFYLKGKSGEDVSSRFIKEMLSEKPIDYEKKAKNKKDRVDVKSNKSVKNNTRNKAKKELVGSTDYSIGCRVQHVLFGVGTVTDIDSEIVTVVFDEQGTKTLSTKFCKNGKMIVSK